MLSCYRILDLTDERGYFCGKILADMGADVIKIEPPGGDPGRSLGPFYKDIADPEKSLYWLGFNTSKRGITLNINCAEGQQLFKKMVRKADIILESFAPGYMDKLGLGYEALRKINPQIIVTSLTPFGQSGPYRDFKGPDIVVSALGGTLYAVGDPDRPPLAPSYPHTHLINSMHATVGTLTALYHRSVIGRGQHVDCAAQPSALFTATAEIEGPWEFEGKTLRRRGRKRVSIRLKGGNVAYYPVVWDCKDGAVAFNFQFGPASEKALNGLVQWMKEEGHDTGRLTNWNFRTMDFSTLDTQEELDEVTETVNSFFLKHTKMELYHKAVEIDLKLGVSLTVEDMLSFPHFKARGFFQKVQYPELGTTLTHAGLPVRFSEAECGIKKRAPFIGEHNTEVYKKLLGLSATELTKLKERKVI
jgi:crotonobetainyl-CoA:carnitine CoA-transferase CaiB-like acyl-CoA transferase